jgi:hypothetical protein
LNDHAVTISSARSRLSEDSERLLVAGELERTTLLLAHRGEFEG